MVSNEKELAMIEILKARKTTRYFDPDFIMSDEVVNELISLANKAPSSFNIQHVRYLVIRDPNLRQQIRQVAMDQAQVTDASILVVVCADYLAWQEGVKEKWSHVDEGTQGFIQQSILNFYHENKVLQRDEAIRSCGMASQNLMLAATALGFDSGPMVGFDFDKVAKLIHLPENFLISNFVVLGKGLEKSINRSPRHPLSKILFRNNFN